MPDPSLPPSDSEPADANLLFQDEPAPARPATPRVPSPTPQEGAYDLEAGTAPAARPRPPVPENERERAPRSQPVSSATVEQVWSRGAEWGPALVLLVLVALAAAGLFYATFDVDDLGPALLVFLLGGATLLVLSYPIAITMERPIRMTPEQAIRDFYGALAHHLPSYRRMWLLLSSAGRTSSEYGSFEGFKRYWKRRLEALRGGTVSGFTPLVFQVQDFHSEKSAGKSALAATFTVVVFARGRQSGPPLASIRVPTTLVRGPDNMWYLDRGTLPDT